MNGYVVLSYYINGNLSGVIPCETEEEGIKEFNKRKEYSGKVQLKETENGKAIKTIKEYTDYWFDMWKKIYHT